MADQHAIEVFSAGCGLCDDAVATVKRIAPDAAVTVHSMAQPDGARRAGELGVRSVPAVAIDGKLADCCTGRGIDEATLSKALT